ncbi:MAG: response regulator, partial [Planctomycetota bacterium]
MQLNVLLVEDEPGIRDGLASFLRLKGMRVTTAGSRSEGLSKLAHDDYDIVVTDWRLGDGLGADIVAASSSPVVIASGVPEEVDVPTTVDDGRNVCIVPKPVMPAQLVDKIEELMPQIESADRGRQPWEGPTLPTDTRDRVRLLLALAGDPAQAEVIDDGSFVTVEAPLTRAQEAHVLGSMAAMERVCGDIRV